jgi:ribokinase
MVARVGSRVCVVGSVNADLTFNVDALPRPGQTVLASSATSSPGGKGGNQAVAAARAGAAVSLVAALGNDAAAEQLRAHLRANDVGLDGLVTLPVPSGTAAIVVDAAAENSIVVAPGANAHLSVTSADVRAVIADSDVVLLQLEIPIATAIAAARIGRSAGATVIVNASPAGAKPHDLLALSESADVVVVNEAEAREWHWPVPHLVITRGPRGASYLGADERFDVPAPAVEAVDTTGAGDVFAGVLAAGWRDGHEDALRRACAAGALSTLIPGAGDCAPYAEAIDDAVTNRKATEGYR